MKIINHTKRKPNIKLWEAVAETYGVEPDFVYILKHRFLKSTKARCAHFFRGLCVSVGYNNIIIIWDLYETDKSIDWLFFHEWRHMYATQHPTVSKSLNLRDRSFSKICTNKDEQLYPSEVDADIFATDILNADFGDQWHDKRLKKHIKGIKK